MNDAETAKQLSIAWTQVQPTVSGYINALVPDFHAAEDILQSVAEIVVRKFDDYDSSRPFLNWSLGIARNEVMHYRRSRARQRVLFDGELMDLLATAFVEQERDSKELRHAMTYCLGSLSGRPAEVFRLRYGEDLSVKGIAERLQTSASTVSVTLHRCREALRKCLSKRLGGGIWNV